MKRDDYPVRFLDFVFLSRPVLGCFVYMRFILDLPSGAASISMFDCWIEQDGGSVSLLGSVSYKYDRI